ncbi:hypothetical protein DB346_19485 [Verrucomicrobia bacterium LW23]|nr:hypothetical protein DB346_19485 [Verrucomicrobia bacterium LW23]
MAGSRLGAARSGTAVEGDSGFGLHVKVACSPLTGTPRRCRILPDCCPSGGIYDHSRPLATLQLFYHTVYMTDANSAAHQEDFSLVQLCLEGDSNAFTTLRDRANGRLMSHLISRGASETEAGDLLGDLWSECAVGREGKAPLFLKYHGKCSLYTWLVTVSLHRLVDLKRRQKFQATLPGHDPEDDVNNFDLLPGSSGNQAIDSDLQEVMRRALKYAIEQTPAEQLILLQLVYLQGLMQREVARMYGWHESKVSRSIDQTMKEIEQRTMLRIKEIDPYLNINWQDFLDLCIGSEGLFSLRR